MADTSQGEGWWEASDHKWYPPRLHADPAYRAKYRPPPPAPIEPPDTPRHAIGGDAGEDDPAEPDENPSTRRDVGDDVFGGRRRWKVKALLVLLLLGAAGAGVFWLMRDDAEAPVDAAAPDASAAGLPVEEPDQLPPEEVGSRARPAAFGGIYEWSDWRAGVVEVLDPDAEGLLAEFAEPPASGKTFVAVVYEVSYLGTDLTGYEPILVTAVGSEPYEAFGCFLDSAALAERNIQVLEFELLTGQTMRLAECFEVPEDEADELVFALENFEEFDGEVVFSPDGEPLPDLDPIRASPDYSEIPIKSFGTETAWEEWTAAITDLAPADEGLVSRFSNPPRAGHSYQVISYEVTYTGSEPVGSLQVYPSVLGSSVFTSQGCVLDSQLLEDRGFETGFELRPNEPVTVAECIEVPDAELDDLVIRLESFGAISDLASYYRADA